MGRLTGIHLAVLLAVLSLVTPAAHAALHDDPDDVGGRLDLRQVSRAYSSQEPSPRLVAHQATTYDGWTRKKCWRRGCRIIIYLDSRQAGGTDRVAYWTVKRRSGRFKPVCAVFDYRRGEQGKRLAVGDAAKFGHHALCWFRTSVLDADDPARSVRWRVLSAWRGKRGPIADRAPDEGWYNGRGDL